MSIITITTLVAKAPLQPLLNFGKLNFPNNEKRYFTGKGAYKSVMLAEVYFYTNSSNQQKIKYKPIIRTTPILGYQVEGQNFQLETGAVIKFGTTWDSFIINPGAYGMEFEEITKEEYNTYVQRLNNMPSNGNNMNYGGNSFGSGSGSSSRACPSCRGTRNCNTCGGVGKYWEEVGQYTGNSYKKKIDCPVCYGTGKCGTCHGKGCL